MKMILIMISLFGSYAFCEKKQEMDRWYCTDEAGHRNARFLYACGVYTADGEEHARAGALQYALGELKVICDNSSDCLKHDTRVESKRMTCMDLGNDKWKCYRLVVMTILN